MVKQGYKQTEIGVIPEDWSCAKIEDIATISMCKRIFADQTTENGDVPFYKIGTFGKEADAYISVALYNEYRNKFSFPQKGDVLISAAGTLGRTVIYDGKDAYFQDSNIVWLDIDKNVLCNEYLNHYYRVIKWASSEGSTIARLYNGIIYATNIALPPLEEQKRIAEALSDVDSMISSLEKLLAKKKAVKQGAMQELLTGQKRLPGFTGEWMSILFKDIYEFAKEGGTPSTSNFQYYHNGKIPFIKIEHLFSKYIEAGKEFITEEGLNNSSAWLIPTESIIFSNGATIGEISINKIPVSTKQGILGIIPKELFSTEFLFYYLSHQMFLNSVKSVTTHGTMDVAYLKDMNNILLYVPKDKKEQIAIATCLADIDNEIEVLEQKLAKTRQIKQGMMQQLLTGKIRLV